MTKLTKWLLAAALAVAVVGSAQAQRQPGGGGRGGLQQPLAVTALTNADLQKELKITDDQKKTLKPQMDKSAELTKKMTDLFGGGQPDREKMTELMQERTKFAEEAKTAVEKVLTDDQKKRVKQLEYQVMGLRAFTNEDVVKGLKLSDDQKATLKTLGEDTQKELQSLRQEYFGGGGPPDMEKMAEWQKKQKTVNDEALAKVTKALTDDQKKAWKEMTGEAFDVSKLSAFGRPMRRDN